MHTIIFWGWDGVPKIIKTADGELAGRIYAELQQQMRERRILHAELSAPPLAMLEAA